MLPLAVIGRMSSENLYERAEGSIDVVAPEWAIVHLRMATPICDTQAIKVPRSLIERTNEKHPHERLAILENLIRVIAGRLRDAYSFIYGSLGEPVRALFLFLT